MNVKPRIFCPYCDYKLDEIGRDKNVNNVIYCQKCGNKIWIKLRLYHKIWNKLFGDDLKLSFAIKDGTLEGWFSLALVSFLIFCYFLLGPIIAALRDCWYNEQYFLGSLPEYFMCYFLVCNRISFPLIVSVISFCKLEKKMDTSYVITILFVILIGLAVKFTMNYVGNSLGDKYRQMLTKAEQIEDTECNDDDPY